MERRRGGEAEIVFKATEGEPSLSDIFEIRRTALMMNISYTTAGTLAARPGHRQRAGVA